MKIEFYGTFMTLSYFKILRPCRAYGRHDMTGVENTPRIEGLDELKRDMQASYGVVLDHLQLREALGYRTATAFQRAIEKGRLGFPVFNCPGRRGKFALAADVAAYLWEARHTSE